MSRDARYLTRNYLPPVDMSCDTRCIRHLDTSSHQRMNIHFRYKYIYTCIIIIIYYVQVKVLMDVKEQQRALSSCHCCPTSGHFGVTKTWRWVAERFYWRGMSGDVKKFVSVKECIYVKQSQYFHVFICL